MDIIRLYEKNKPYHPGIESSINNAYSGLASERSSKYLFFFPFVLGCALTSRGHRLRKGLVKAAVVGVVGAGVIEAEVWNKFLIQLYLVQKYEQK